MRARSQSPNDTGRGSPMDGSRVPSPARCHSTLPVYGPRTKDASPYNASLLRQKLPKNYAVDYSYKGFRSFGQMTSEVPRSGVVFQRKDKSASSPVPQITDGSAASASPSPQTNTQLGELLKQNASKHEVNPQLFQFGDKQRNNGKTQVTDDGVVVIKAKDENYAFRDADQGVYTSDKDMANWVLDANGNLVRRKLTSKEEQALLESRRTLYRCNTLKLNNNEIDDLEKLDRALYLTLYKPIQNVNVLDLSCNRITTIPVDFAVHYPIHSLLLHGNLLTSFDEVRKLRCLSATLRTLTLFDTPLQRSNGRKYRMTVLCILPFITSLDDVHVTNTEREKLETFVDIFVKKKERTAMRQSLHNTITSGSSVKLPTLSATVTQLPH